MNHQEALDSLRRAAGWRKSGFSDEKGNCVVINTTLTPEGWVGLGDSKTPDGVIHAFTLGEFRAFVAGVREGEFDV